MHLELVKNLFATSSVFSFLSISEFAFQNQSSLRDRYKGKKHVMCIYLTKLFLIHFVLEISFALNLNFKFLVALSHGICHCFLSLISVLNTH